MFSLHSDTRLTHDPFEDSRVLVHELTGRDTGQMSRRELVDALEHRLGEVRPLADVSEAAACEAAFVAALVDELRPRLALH